VRRPPLRKEVSMTEFFPETEIDQDAAEAIARGLYAVAQADGDIHPREAAIIGEFFASTVDHPAQLSSLARESRIDADSLAARLPTPDLRRLFLKTALLTAYADGSYGAGEKKVIDDYAAGLGVSRAELEELQQMVKEYLLSQISHLSNVDALAQVARELDD